ncbi:MAG: type II toxin-antitoxin system VapC family toxin [Chloroflexi bacterium]|nr:type II toxin-antitoxin system VapC family toxin [Chloroflexota bacterium]
MVIQVVLDASVTIGWLPEDEQDTFSLSVHRSVQEDGAVVPQHWEFEVANSLLFAERRGRLGRGEARQRFHYLDDLAIEIDAASELDHAFSLAADHDLTLYDALYLELTIRHNLPLATLDNELERAANARGVEVFSG